MSLLNLKTDLKSLKFGKDRPGGGSSGQPYVQKPIPEGGDPSNIFNTGGPDNILRGGLITPERAADDVSRLTKMFIDAKSPNGPLFTPKQLLLSRTGVQVEAGGGTPLGKGIFFSPFLLAQAASGHLGFHTESFPIDEPGTYEAIAKENNDLKNNRLLILNEKVNNQTSINNFNFLGVNLNIGNTLLSYPGGPGSQFGVGRTNIKFADQRTGINNKLAGGDQISNKKYFYTGSFSYDSDRFNFNNYLEASTKQGLDPENDNDINGLGQLSGKFYGGIGKNSTLSKLNPTNLPLSGSGSYQSSFSYDSNRFNFNNYLEASTKQGLDPENDNGIGANGKLSSKFYGRVKENSTLSTNNPTGQNLSGSGAYQSSFSYDNNKLNFNNYLGVSNDEGLDPESNGIGGNNKLSRLFGGIEENGTLGKSIFPASPNDKKYFYTGSKDPIFHDENDDSRKEIRLFEDVTLLKGVSKLYNSLISSTPSSSILSTNYSDKLGFSVYDPIIPGNTWPKTNDLQSQNGSSTFTQEDIIAQGENGGKSIQDFRTQLPEIKNKTSNRIVSLAPGYTDANIEKRLNLGDPGRSNQPDNVKNVLRYSTSNEALDKINALEMYKEANPIENGTTNDLVKFRIAAISNDKTDGTAVYMHFRAFIDSFSDSYTGNWGDVNYVGRGNKFYTYEGFDRKISMAFTVYAQSKAELIPMYKKLNYLASTLAPDYSSGGFMRGNLIRLTMGGYLYEQPGFITSLTYDIPETSTWEIGINESGRSDRNVKELPHMIKVTGLSFTPIHTFLPQKVEEIDPYSGERYIALSNGKISSNNYDIGFQSPPQTLPSQNIDQISPTPSDSSLFDFL